MLDAVFAQTKTESKTASSKDELKRAKNGWFFGQKMLQKGVYNTSLFADFFAKKN